MELDFDIASWVKEARSHWGKSQEALGDLLGKTKGNISAWEKGRHDPSFKQVLQISAITGHPLPAEIGIKFETGATNDSPQVDVDELVEVIRGYKDANISERQVILQMSRRAIRRASDAGGESSAPQ